MNKPEFVVIEGVTFHKGAKHIQKPKLLYDLMELMKKEGKYIDVTHGGPHKLTPHQIDILNDYIRMSGRFIMSVCFCGFGEIEGLLQEEWKLANGINDNPTDNLTDSQRQAIDSMLARKQDMSQETRDYLMRLLSQQQK
jgi:hypothetical protein